MKVDFRKVEVKDITGKNSVLDISKELGNGIFNETADLGELETAREIYKNGEIEINDPQQAAMLSKYVRTGFKAFIQEALCPVLDNLFNNDKKDK